MQDISAKPPRPLLSTHRSCRLATATPPHEIMAAAHKLVALVALLALVASVLVPTSHARVLKVNDLCVHDVSLLVDIGCHRYAAMQLTRYVIYMRQPLAAVLRALHSLPTYVAYAKALPSMQGNHVCCLIRRTLMGCLSCALLLR
jgi:hypothetical protein